MRDRYDSTNPTTSSSTSTSTPTRTTAIVTTGRSRPTTAAAALDYSDKENSTGASEKGKGRMVSSSQRRGGGGGARLGNVIEEEAVGDRQFYDPDQPPEIRRVVRKGLRDLGRKVHDSRQEFLNPTSNGLLTAIEETNALYKSVKQTSDATLDSRILVSAADMVYARSKNLTIGSSTTTIDVDEFLGRIITYLKTSPLHNYHHDDDPYDWSYLGRTAAFKGNKRPPTTDFLLGPLSVTKRARLNPTAARRANRLTKNPANVIRPQELRSDEITKQENTTTKLVMTLHRTLTDHLVNNDLFESGINYFRFIINPHSFSQTVENAFYVSFLVRDGRAAVFEGDDGLPMLGVSEAPTAEETRSMKLTKKQIITALDMWSWRELIKVFDIKDTIIPMREEEQQVVGANGWYA